MQIGEVRNNMGDRTTLKDINLRLKAINLALGHTRSGREIRLGRRYGYKALDLYDKKGNMKRTLVSGLSSGQVMKYLDAFQDGMIHSRRK